MADEHKNDETKRHEADYREWIKEWDIWQFRELIRSKKEERQDTKKHDTKPILHTPEVTHHANLLKTPSQRIFAELYGINKYQERDKFKDGDPEEALKKDNVSMEELVNIINEQKKEQKFPKVKELAEIFMMAGEEMEWEKIKNQMKVEEATMKIKSLESVIKLREKLIKEAET
uniref:Uncharacterized protein n=1 Tax=Rhizophagus irregularis (strain DAOM 181602 / DAOM 197198 / MUCL 43194) TaxID=747089 RepID=U9U9X3_RHIID